MCYCLEEGSRKEDIETLMGSPSPSSNVVCIEYGDEREGIGRDDRRTSGSTTTDLEGEVSRTVRLFRDPTAM